MLLGHSRLRGTSNFHIDDGRRFRNSRVTQIILRIPNQSQVKLPALLSVAIRRGGRMARKVSSCVYSPESAEHICGRIRMLIPLTASAPLETEPRSKNLWWAVLMPFASHHNTMASGLPVCFMQHVLI
jgi:hypothetical protein